MVHPTTFRIHTICLLLLLLILTHALPIDDFERSVRASDPYNDLTSDCSRCALAGAKGTGCYGNVGVSAVRNSLCSDETCFCDTKRAACTAQYLWNFALEACKQDEYGAEAVSAFASYCGIESFDVSALKENQSVIGDNSTCSGNSTSSSLSPTPTDNIPLPSKTSEGGGGGGGGDLNLAEKIGIPTGLVAAIAAVVVIWLTIRHNGKNKAAATASS